MSVPAARATDVDVLIVGAGMSGLGAACHLQRDMPGKSYAIVEARDAIGGTCRVVPRSFDRVGCAGKHAGRRDE